MSFNYNLTAFWYKWCPYVSVTILMFAFVL